MSVVMASHVFTHGTQHHHHEYLVRRARILEIVSHPLPIAHMPSRLEVIENGTLIRTIEVRRFTCPELISYLLDSILTIFFVLRMRKKINVYIGTDSLNAMAGLFLKRLGVVRFVIYYCHSYLNDRFGNPAKNLIYHAMDAICAKSSDAIWNLTRRLVLIRRQQGVPDHKNIHVPESVDQRLAEPATDEEVHPSHAVFFGLLVPINGVELALRAMPIVRNVIRNAKLTIIGGGPQEADLKDLAERLGISDCVRFMSYTPYDQALHMMSKMGVGVAPYKPIPNSPMWTSDSSKAKDYMICGLPVIMTDFVEGATEISQTGAGITIKYDVNQLAQAMITLMGNRTIFKQARKNARQLIAKYELNRNIGNAWEKTLQCFMKGLVKPQPELGSLALILTKEPES